MDPERRVQLTVDGRSVETSAGTSLLDLLRALDIRVPTLCHDPRLTPYGGCRLCVVARQDGRGGLVPACSTPALQGMVIDTRTDDVREARRQQLLLLALNHRLECPACERTGDCRFQDLLYEYGVSERRLPFDRVRTPRDERSSVIVRDPEKCILCGKCVRLCDEVQGVAAIGIVHRGLQARVVTPLERILDCEFCGQCVNACPVGALLAKPYVSEVPAWLRDTRTTTCSFCSCGCQVNAEVHANALLRVGADEHVAPNHGKLCAKGWLGLDVLGCQDRLRQPLIRRDGRLVETTWSEALSAAARALAGARTEGRRVVGIGGSRLTCEDAYLMQRLLRTAVATPHVGVGSAGGAAALSDGMAPLTGAPRSSATFDDLRAADLVLVLRADPTRTHPMIKTDLVQGVRQRRQTLVLAHALSGGLERHAALYLPLDPASEDTLLLGVSARLLALDPAMAAHARALPGFEAWSRSLEAYTPQTVEGLTATAPAALDALCGLLRQARRVVTVVVTGRGIPGDEAAVTRAAASLDALLGPQGGGVLVLGEKANLQGTLDAGLHPAWLPGGRRSDDVPARTALEGAWQHAIAPASGLSLAEAIQDRPIGVLYIAGDDPAGAWPRALGGADAVARAECVIVHDAFLSETARSADIVLPVAVLAEREGSVVGADGVRRTLRRVLAPPEGVPPDAQIFQELARQLGSPAPAGPQLEAEMVAAIGWPVPRPRARRLLAAPAPAVRDRWTGMLLDASPQLFHSGSIADRSARLQELAPPIALRLSPADAAQLGVRNGEPVRLAVNGRETLLRARLDRRVRPGTVVAHWRARRDFAASRSFVEGQPMRVEIRRST